MRFEDKLIENLDFGRFGLNSSVFEKLFVSYSHFFIKQCALRSFYIKMLYFSKIWFFSSLSIDRTCFSINRNCDWNFWFESAWLNWYSIDAQSIETKKFSVSKYLTNLFFHASFMFRIHMHCIVFCIHLAVL